MSTLGFGKVIMGSKYAVAEYIDADPTYNFVAIYKVSDVKKYLGKDSYGRGDLAEAVMDAFLRDKEIGGRSFDKPVSFPYLKNFAEKLDNDEDYARKYIRALATT